MKKLLFILFAYIAIASASQAQVTQYTPGVGADGVTYYLPQTRINITIVTRQIIRTPGEFAKYAGRYLRLSNVVENEESYQEIQEITVSEEGEPDKEKCYTVKLADNSSASNVQLTKNGIIQSINLTEPMAESGAKAIPQPKEPVARPDPKNYLTEEILLSSSKAKMAELTAKEIYEIRESKNAIIRGQADNMPKDGESLKLMIDGLNKQENALMQLFVGTQDTITHIYQINLIPKKGEEINRAILCRFSRKLGILAANNLAGAPIYYDLKSLKTVAVADEAKAKEKKSVKMAGIVCSIPEQATLTVYSNNDNYYEGSLPIGQWGNTEVLSPQLFSKKNKTQVIFDTTTGAVKQIKK